MLKRRIILAMGLTFGILAPAAASPVFAAPKPASLPIQVTVKIEDTEYGSTGRVKEIVDQTYGPVEKNGSRELTTVTKNASGIVTGTSQRIFFGNIGSNYGGGCCSAKGSRGLHVLAEVYVGPYHVYEMDAGITYCWGGGVPGVHWGYVYNCSYPPGSNVYPDDSAGIDWVGAYVSNPRIAQVNQYYQGWAHMAYSRNTQFHFAPEGAADFSFQGLTTTILHWMTFDVYADGEYSITQ